MNILLMANMSNPRFHSVWKFLASSNHQVDVTEDHREMDLTKYDLGVSWYYRKMVGQKALDTFRHGVINLHPGRLPDYRGAFTNVFPIACGTDAGVSMQLMDAGLDTGPMIAERVVKVLPTDTGETLWYRLVEEQYQFLVDEWPRVESEILAGTLKVYPQRNGTFDEPWKMQDAFDLDNLDQYDEFGEAYDVLRARTHSQYPGCYVIRDGRKIGVRVQLEDLGPA